MSDAALLAQYGGDDEQPREAEVNTVWINEKRYPAARVQPNNLARFLQQVTIGDPTINSDDLFSALIQNDWRGGGQILESVEGSTDERYWDALINSEFTHQLSLPREVVTVEGPSGVFAAPGADFNDRFHAVYGTTLVSWDTATDDWDTVKTLSNQPVGEMVEWNQKLYIPLGANGYDEWDPAGAGTLTTDATIHAIGFVVWDNKLYTMTLEGGFRRFNNPGWTAPTNPGPLYLPSGTRPRKLVMYVNEQGDDVPFIATDRRVYSYDPIGDRLVGTRMHYPPHPELGHGFTNWRDEAIYTSAGIGIYAYNGSTIAPVGLDRNDGIPAQYRGHIASLAPWLNGITALVEGEASLGSTPSGAQFDVGVWRDTELVGPSQTTVSALWNYTGAGWHKWWQSSTDGTPTWSYVSVADGEYRLWWGFGGDLYTIELPKNYHTPEQGLRAGIDRFQQTGFLETARYDMGMAGFFKLGSHTEVRLRDALGNGTSTGTVTVYYRTDLDQNYRILGSTSQPGKAVFPIPREPRMIATDVGDDSDEHGIHDYEHYDGEHFGWIQFFLEFEQAKDDAGAYIPTYSPIVESFILKSIKLPLSGMAWIINIPLNFDASMWDDRDAHAMWHELNNLTTNTQFVPFLHQNDYARCAVTQAIGEQMTGPLPFASIQFSLIEAKLPESEFIEDASA